MSEDIVGFRVQGLGLMGQEGATKKCGNCHKLLLLLLFATKPKTTELYVNCEPCRLKDAAQKRKKRAADKSTRNAALEADVTPTTLPCERCGPQPFAAFGLHPTTGKPLTRCKPCNVKNIVGAAAYHQTEAGKAANKRAKTSDKGKAATKRYQTSDKGKAANKRAKTSEKGKERKKRGSDRHMDRRRASTAMRMDNAIRCLANNLISGRSMTSPTFLERTSFASEQEFFDVLEATFAHGMDFKNHGAVWEVEHKIPREAYDFDDPEDVKRCWSAKNVHVMTPAANMEKSWQLLDEYIAAAGVANFPKAWNDQVPDDVFKAAHNAKMMAWKMLADEEAAGERPSGSDDDDDDAAMSEHPPGSEDEDAAWALATSGERLVHHSGFGPWADSD